MKVEIKSSEHDAGKGYLWEHIFGFALMDLVLSFSAMWWFSIPKLYSWVSGFAFHVIEEHWFYLDGRLIVQMQLQHAVCLGNS